MLVIPAIDLKNDNAVRLFKGLSDQETIYSSTPEQVAKDFELKGAKKLHLIDLDGAFDGKTKNIDSIKAIRKAINIPIELGGGIRSFEDAKRILDLGIDHVIIGTMAVKNPDELSKCIEAFGDKIILGIDCKVGKVAVNGWVEGTTLNDDAFALDWKAKGIQRVIYTDIATDGTLEGPNIKALTKFSQKTQLKVTASGGISVLKDIIDLKELNSRYIDSVIVGKAIYENKVSLDEIFIV